MDGASETHSLISGVQSNASRLIVDPADGKIPYLPWAQAKRQDIFDNHNNPTKSEHVDPAHALLAEQLSPAHVLPRDNAGNSIRAPGM